MTPPPEYDDRYLAGILFFNAGDFFEAHEVWEDLWHVATGPERPFYQGLIQTAVALFHLGNRNVRGAVRLFHSSRDYLARSRPRFLGLDVDGLFARMEQCFAPYLITLNAYPALAADTIPTLHLARSQHGGPIPKPSWTLKTRKPTMSEFAKDFGDFNGTVRLFPLPNFVMLPHVVKPFHIFEPRYKEMTEDALAGDRLITLVLLKEDKEGMEPTGLGTPPIAEMACLTRIVNEQRQPDGRFNLLLRGLCRVRLVKEITSLTQYRQAMAEPVPDVEQEPQPELRDALAAAAKLWLPPQGPAQAQFHSLLGSDLPLGALCDIVGFAMPLPPEIKQALLEETDIDARARKLVGALVATQPPVMQVESPPFRHRKYPPEFSQN